MKSITIFGAIAPFLMVSTTAIRDVHGHHLRLKAELEMFAEPSCSSPYINGKQILREGKCTNLRQPFQSFIVSPDNTGNFANKCEMVIYRHKGCTGEELRHKNMVMMSGKCRSVEARSKTLGHSARLTCRRPDGIDLATSPAPSYNFLANEKKHVSMAHFVGGKPHTIDAAIPTIISPIEHPEIFRQQCSPNRRCRGRHEGCDNGYGGDCNSCQPYVCSARTETKISCRTELYERPMMETLTRTNCLTKMIIHTPVLTVLTSMTPAVIYTQEPVVSTSMFWRPACTKVASCGGVQVLRQDSGDAVVRAPSVSSPASATNPPIAASSSDASKKVAEPSHPVLSPRSPIVSANGPADVVFVLQTDVHTIKVD